MWLALVILYIQSHPQRADPRPLEGGPADQQLLMSRTPLPAFGHFPSLPLGVQVVAGGTSRNPQIQSGPQGRLVYAAYSLHGEGELELCGRITAFRSVPHSDPGPRRTASPVWVCHLSLVPTLLSPHPWAPNLRSPSAPLSTPLARQQGKPTALVPGGGVLDATLPPSPGDLRKRDNLCHCAQEGSACTFVPQTLRAQGRHLASLC